MREIFELWDSEEKEIIEVEGKKVGKEWRAFCPKHGDKKSPNLDINEGKGVYLCRACGWTGRVYKPTQYLTHEPKKKVLPQKKPTLINCQEIKERAKGYQGNIPMEIREARGLTDEIIEKYQLGYCENHPNYPDHKKSITIPIYHNGKLVNIRYHSLNPKRKKEAAKILPYQNSLPFATWLYPEDQLENDTLIVTEGELDALCCISQSLPAITRTCGALVWKHEFTNYFKHKVIYIIQDCDKAGRDGAKKIAQELVKVAREIRIINLGLKDGEDLTNWFVIHEKNKEELLKLIQKTPVYIDPSLPKPGKLEEKKSQQEEKYQEEIKQGVQEILESVIDGQELSEKKFEPEQFWVSDGLIPKKGVVVLASYKSRGKTSFVLQMSLKLSKGNSKFLNYFDIKESPKKILFWYGENQPEEIQAIRNLQEKSMNLNLTEEQRKILNLMPRGKLDFVQKKNIDKIKGAISQLSPDIIIVDTLGWFLSGKRCNDAQTYFYLYDTLIDIKEDCLWILITHNRKPSKEDIADEPVHKIAGSGALANNATSVIMIDRYSSKKSILYSKISFILTRGKPVEPINTKFNIETRCLDVLAEEGNIAPAVATAEDIRDLIRTVGKGEATPKEIIDWGIQKYKLNDKTIYNLLKEAKDKGLITQEIVGGKTRGNKYHAL